ncbi:MAG TPA: protein kinase, partial [Pyrinomonadaceae bacterium]|nr:protein kinase [Pyrinomonadaceae bacterium]
KVGRYTIQRLLGIGGMGQIYLAHDERLGRNVALKFISREFATDPRRVRRFEQEARVVSSLNHPNVCVIHETGVTENIRHYIAMEYIQGITLREKLQGGALPLLEAVHIAIHVAAALASAHAAGIVHRDIKPENIMLHPDGYVKVLDFGLAKLLERVPHAAHGSSAMVHTEAGTLMGTVKYMSPEQLREDEVDERTDIWSLGVVLYEMLTRTTPFEARTPSESIALILGPQTPPLTFADQLPAPFGEIVRKAIEKDRAVRYQTVKQLSSDLNTLKKDLERQMENGVVYSQPLAWLQPVTGQEVQRTQPTRTWPSSAIFTRIKSQAISTADFLLTEIKMHKTAAVFTGATGVLLLLLLIPGAARFVNRMLDRDADQQTFTIKSFTNAGTSFLAAISPDGKLVAHVEEQFGKQSVLVKGFDTDSPSVLLPALDVNYLGVTFSPDNSYIYLTRREGTGPGLLYRLLSSGSGMTLVKQHVDSPVTFSPQGDRFAFVRYDERTSEYSLVTSNVDGSNERTLTTRKGRETLSTFGLSWAPNGSMIVCPVGRWEQGHQMRLIGVDVETGAERVLGQQTWFSIYQAAWQADMSGLIICAREQPSAPHQLWRVTYPEGITERVTNTLDEYKGVSVSGGRIVTVRTGRPWRIWLATTGARGESVPIASGVGFTYGMNWTTGNKIVHSSMIQDKLNISRIDTDGNNVVRLTKDADNYNPVVSVDGRFVVFASTRQDGRANIWRINTEDGGDLKQITFTDANYYPSISPDNKWIAYDNQLDRKLSIWKVPFEGGEPVKIIDGYRMPVFSPDGRFIAARYDHESGTEDIAIFSADGGEPLQRVPIPILEWQRVQWLDTRTLSYIDSINGTSNLWSYDLNTGATKQLTFFDSDQIVAYAWSPDFKQVACQRVASIGDVTIISSER